MTQRERVLAMLRQGPVCGTVFLEYRIPRYAARILELRQGGYVIHKVPCPYTHHSHTKAIATYQLIGRPQ